MTPDGPALDGGEAMGGEAELRREVESLRKTCETLIARLKIQSALRTIDGTRLMTETCTRRCPLRRSRWPEEERTSEVE